MLILTRGVGERLMIGDDIAIVVADVRNGQVRLGIDAPAGIHILREELLQPRVKESPPEPPASDLDKPSPTIAYRRPRRR